MTDDKIKKIPPGYKQTELGVIPEDWEVKRLWEVVQTIKTGKLDANAMRSNGKYKFFTCAKEVYLINTYDFDTEALLISGNGANVGYIHYYKGKFNAYQRTYVLYNFLNVDILYIKFLLEKFLKQRINEEVKAGNTPYIVKGTLTQMYLYSPLIPEQQAIARVLSDVDELIESLSKLIEKKKNIKKGAMQELLTGKRRLPGFGVGKGYKQTELGIIPEDWEVKRLGEVAKFYDNQRIPVTESDREFGATPYYGANGVLGYIKGYTHKGEFVLFAEDGASDLNDYPIIYVVGTIWVNNHAHVVSAIKSKADTKFLSYVLKIINFNKILLGGTRVKLNGGIARKIELILPANIKEQQAIARVLSDMDEEIEALEKKKAKYENLKKAMMQVLLTGKIRLKNFTKV